METEFPTPGLRSEWIPLDTQIYTIDDYLNLARASEVKHMFLDGTIYEFNGENWAHGGISVNALVSLALQLKKSPFHVHTKLTNIYTGHLPARRNLRTGMFSFPDIVVFDDPEYFDGFKDIILNPKVIVEVLAPATEAFDRGEKFRRYRNCNPTLSDYVLISQDKPQLEHFRRLRNGDWHVHIYIGLDVTMEIASIGCTLDLADVYDRVQFAEE